MKTLILIRHAKSSWNTPGMADFDRVLNSRGLADAPVMGERLCRHLAARQQQLDVLLCSAAQRADQTARLLASALDFPVDSIEWHRALYLASPRTMLSLLQSLPDTADTVALVAHNPGISDLAGQLIGEYFADVPTCSVISMSLPIEHWRDAGQAASLIDYDYPKR